MATKARVDLWRLGEGDVRRELVDGEIVELTPVGGIHGEVTGRVYGRLSGYVERHGGGKVVVGDVGFVLSLPNDPSASGRPTWRSSRPRACRERGLPEGFLNGAPDLAVEVLSPRDNPGDIQQKCGTTSRRAPVWSGSSRPRPRPVTVYRPDGSARLLRERDALEGEDVLPGLTIPLAEVFR